MSRIILIYGAIAGLVIIVINTLSLELGHGQFWLGLLVMFIAFSTIFVAIKQYRDEVLGGLISFSVAVRLGLGISLVASMVYVVVWELYLALTDYRFIEEYASSMADTQAVEEVIAQYSKPLFRLPVTFLEVFPAGLVVSLTSAAVLRNHRSAGASARTAKGKS
jgi:hypothetical protein